MTAHQVARLVVEKGPMPVTSTAMACFAVLDPDTGKPTMWKRNRRGALMPWPAGASYGPRLHRGDFPPGLDADARRDFVLGWCRERAVPWRQAIERAVVADPHGCAALFAHLTGRCACCTRPLTDHPGGVTGACVGCRGRLPADDLSGLVGALGRLRVGTVRSGRPATAAA